MRCKVRNNTYYYFFFSDILYLGDFMKCNRCGYINNNTSRYCAQCGCILSNKKNIGIMNAIKLPYSIINGIALIASFYLCILTLEFDSNIKFFSALTGITLVYIIIHVILNLVYKINYKVQNYLEYLISSGAIFIIGAVLYILGFLFLSKDPYAGLMIIIGPIYVGMFIIPATCITLGIDILMSKKK